MTIYRVQAEGLEIEAAAKRRLADEYDAAQERGEVAKRGQRNDFVPEEDKVPTARDVGLNRKDIQDARQFRDAEAREPGVTKRAINGLVAVCNSLECPIFTPSRPLSQISAISERSNCKEL